MESTRDSQAIGMAAEVPCNELEKYLGTLKTMYTDISAAGDGANEQDVAGLTEGSLGPA